MGCHRYSKKKNNSWSSSEQSFRGKNPCDRGLLYYEREKIRRRGQGDEENERGRRRWNLEMVMGPGEHSTGDHRREEVEKWQGAASPGTEYPHST